jgi:hypothetical protein
MIRGGDTDGFATHLFYGEVGDVYTVWLEEFKNSQKTSYILYS